MRQPTPYDYLTMHYGNGGKSTPRVAQDVLDVGELKPYDEPSNAVMVMDIKHKRKDKGVQPSLASASTYK